MDKPKALIIRSVPFQQLDSNLPEIQKQFPEHELHLLTHEHGRKLAEKYRDIKKVVIYPHSRSFSFWRLETGGGGEKYDAVIIPVANETGAGFGNVIFFSLRLPASNRFLIDLVSTTRSLTPFMILWAQGKSMVFKLAALLASLLACIVVIPLLGVGILTTRLYNQRQPADIIK